MNKNFKIVVEYDGTPFGGWQKQNNQITVQGEIEQALTQILIQEIKLTGSGRTDAGVHATGQVANFHATTNIDPHNIKKSLNSIIKQPIVVRTCELVDNEFHAQYHAVSKEYHYHILNREDACAIGRQYQWHVRQPLDISVMNQCCEQIVGEFDFKSFENMGTPKLSTIRKVFHAFFNNPEKDQIMFSIIASGFLRYMVRNIVGTLIQVGLHKIQINDFIQIFQACDRTKAAPPAPAHGLFLHQVNYS
ncbi:MAG: tRNA pseudouridine(38-40) synthase TruA [Pseudomonadota bacterium]